MRNNYSIEDHFNDLENLVSDSKIDLIKFYKKKNKSSGTRLRKRMMECIRTARIIKNLAMEIHKTLPKGVSGRSFVERVLKS